MLIRLCHQDFVLFYANIKLFIVLYVHIIHGLANAFLSLIIQYRKAERYQKSYPLYLAIKSLI